MKDDSKARYGTISRILHWGMAFLIFWQALKIFDRIDDGEHWVGETLVPWHVSIGTLLFGGASWRWHRQMQRLRAPGSWMRLPVRRPSDR